MDEALPVDGVTRGFVLMPVLLMREGELVETVERLRTVEARVAWLRTEQDCEVGDLIRAKLTAEHCSS